MLWHVPSGRAFSTLLCGLIVEGKFVFSGRVDLKNVGCAFKLIVLLHCGILIIEINLWWQGVARIAELLWTFQISRAVR